MSWALELKKDIKRYQKNLSALQKHDADLQHTIEILKKAQEKADGKVNREIENLQRQIDSTQAERESGSEILQLNGELAALQEALNAVDLIVAEKDELAERYSELEEYYQTLIGSRLHYERLISEHKRKFWTPVSSYKKELKDTQAALQEAKEKLLKIVGELRTRGQEFALNAAEKKRITTEIRDVKKQIEEFLKKKEEEIKALHSDIFNLRFGERELNVFLTKEDERFITKSLSLLMAVDMQFAQENYPELSQTLSLLVGDSSLDCENSLLWNGVSVLCKNKLNEIFDEINFDEDGEYQIISDDVIIYPKFPCETVLSEDSLKLSEQYFEESKEHAEEKENDEECESDEDDDIIIEVPVITWTVTFSESSFEHVFGEESISISSSNFLNENILNALLSEIEKDNNVNFPTLILNLWESCAKETEVSKPIIRLVKEMKRLFELPPEQVLIEEQRYYKEKEIEQLEENARLERAQRDEHARLQREEIEFQARLDRRQREKEEQRRAEREEEQLRIQREAARAEQRRWEEDRQREDQRQEQERKAAESRRKQEERDRWNQSQKEEREMRHLCGRCANYCNGCRGGIPRCGNFRSKY